MRSFTKYIIIIIAFAAAGCGGGTLSGGFSNDTDESEIVCDNESVVVITLPAGGETAAARNTQITIILPSGASTSSFDLANFVVSSASGEIAGDASADEGSNSITFVANDLLPANAVIFVSALHDICDEGTPSVFSFYFTTGNSPDGLAPKAVASSILDGATGVGTNAQVIVFFDEALAPASVSGTTVALESGGASVPGTATFDSSNNSIVFQPTADLNPLTSYILRIHDVTDAAGNAMSGTYELGFTTGEAPDTTPPSTPVLAKKAFARATLEWTAPGDDGNVGTAASYRMRYSSQPIVTDADFELGTPIGDLPAPLVAGTLQDMIVPGMTPRDGFFFALRAIDEAGNESDFSSFQLDVSASPLLAIEGAATDDPSDEMGRSVAGVCDINGDGLDDIVIGIPNDDIAGLQTGKVAVYFGSSTGDIGFVEGVGRTPDIVIEGVDSHGSSDDDYFGRSVACSGDFNGGGKDDVLVGAPYEDTSNGSTYRRNSGAAYLFYGENLTGPFPKIINATLDSDIIFQGSHSYDYFGWSVAFIGDIDGDGRDDLGAAAMRYWLEHQYEGIAHIFYGSDMASGSIVFDDASDIKVEGEQAGEGNYGLNEIVRGGDVDGDGLIDLAFAATRYPADDKGKAYIYLGKNGYPNYIDLDTDADVTITGEVDNDFLGGDITYPTALSIDGDINGDGFDDIIVGAYGVDGATYNNVGEVYVFFGSSNPAVLGDTSPSAADVTISGTALNSYLGVSLDARSDFNHDGIQDLLVGGYGFNNGVGGSLGGAFIFYGNGSLPANIVNTDAQVIIANDAGLADNVGLPYTSSGDYWGFSVSSAGDVNGDGYDDVILGGPRYDMGGVTNTGAAYIIY